MVSQLRGSSRRANRQMHRVWLRQSRGRPTGMTRRSFRSAMTTRPLDLTAGPADCFGITALLALILAHQLRESDASRARHKSALREPWRASPTHYLGGAVSGLESRALLCHECGG